MKITKLLWFTKNCSVRGSRSLIQTQLSMKLLGGITRVIVPYRLDVICACNICDSMETVIL